MAIGFGLGVQKTMARKEPMMRNRRHIMLALALLPALATAQRSIADKDYNVWLLEQPAVGSGLKVRMAGVARYNHFQSVATLAFSCGSATSRVHAELAVGISQLGFNADAYEGPSATVDGPITLTSGSGQGLQQRVGGFYGDGGPFDTGTPFIFDFEVPIAQVRQWTTDSVRGQLLRVSVPATQGGAPMTIEFSWPLDDTVFKRVVGPCVDAAAQKTMTRPGH
jgi:hypothetical protein